MAARRTKASAANHQGLAAPPVAVRNKTSGRLLKKSRQLIHARMTIPDWEVWPRPLTLSRMSLDSAHQDSTPSKILHPGIVSIAPSHARDCQISWPKCSIPSTLLGSNLPSNKAPDALVHVCTGPPRKMLLANYNIWPITASRRNVPWTDEGFGVY